ncbi:MAG: hypothetical protein FJW69_01820 [Actinobacteria bacterium]|nr:hypothetical protein [Actinomycetota bacterium]
MPFNDDDNFDYEEKRKQESDEDFFGKYPPEKESEYGDEEPVKEEDEDIEESFFKDSDFDLKGYREEEYDEYGARSSKARERGRKRKVIISTLVIMSVLVLAAIGIVFGFRYIKNKYFSGTIETTTGEEEAIVVPSSLKLGRDLNIVISCAQDSLLEPRINSVFYSQYTSSKSELITLCFPVNTLFEIPGFGLDSLDRSVEYGGMELLGLTVESNIGMDIDNYLLLDVANVVNKLEGIKLELDKDITITDDDGSKVELKQGENILNGDDALTFLKYFNGTTADISISDIKKQKLLFDSIMIKIAGTKEEDLTRNLTKINDYVDTDLNLEELSGFISTISQLTKEQNKVYVLDGRVEPLEEGNLVFVPDISRVFDIFKQQVLVEDETDEFETGPTLSLSVLNGVGIKGIAKKTSEIFIGLKYSDGTLKFNVTTIADADNYNYADTQIILKSDDEAIMKAAEGIKNVMLAGSITIQDGDSQNTDIVIIIGKDFNYDKAVEALQASTSETTSESSETAETTTGESAGEGVIFTVNVLNGEGTAGIAKTVSGILKENLNKDTKTIEVKEAKDADSFNYNITKILTHTDKEGIENVASKIKEVLGVGTISSSSDNPDKVDITVIIGSDYTK